MQKAKSEKVRVTIYLEDLEMLLTRGKIEPEKLFRFRRLIAGAKARAAVSRSFRAPRAATNAA